MFFPHHTVQVKKMSDQQFVLRWHYHETTLLQNLPSLLENDILTDVTLSVGTQFLKAHRLVLAMCSVYFLQIFQEMGGSQNPVIVLHNVNIEDVKAVLAFMYRGQCIVSKEQLPSLLSVARLLKIQGLCDMKVPEKSLDDSTLNENKIEMEENYVHKPDVDTKPSETQTDDIIHDYTLKSKEKTEITLPNKSCSDTTLKHKKDFNINYINWDNLSVVPDMIQYDYNQNYNTSVTKKPAKDTPETCKCFLCGKYLSNQYNLRVHMETHEEAYHACQSCPHVSRSRDALRKHVSYRHPEEYHTRKRKKTDNV